MSLLFCAFDGGGESVPFRSKLSTGLCLMGEGMVAKEVRYLVLLEGFEVEWQGRFRKAVFWMEVEWALARMSAQRLAMEARTL